MRNRGRKIAAADLRAMVPARGRLWLTNFRPAADNTFTPLMAALQAEGGDGNLFPVLDRAEVRTIRDGQLVIVGIEDLGDGRKKVLNFRQAWWCWIVGDPTQSPTPRQSFEKRTRRTPQEAEA